MALNFFEDSTSSNGSLDFVNDYLEENPKEHGKIFEVTEFKLASSGKGYLLYTDKFMCFLFKNAKLTKQVIEALEYYCSQPNGYAFFVQLDKGHKQKFKLAVDPEEPRTWFNSKNGFTQQSIDTGEGVEIPQSNPFLIQPLTTPPSESTGVALRTTNSRGGRNQGAGKEK